MVLKWLCGYGSGAGCQPTDISGRTEVVQKLKVSAEQGETDKKEDCFAGERRQQSNHLSVSWGLLFLL